ncbi:MAG: dihydroorotase [Kaiparowitsia implicata GSE-PSE-MK54-09C]|nr:dihydroorotase [Kaiparowitsia implicata GSE-PSE-MK54-09C]
MTRTPMFIRNAQTLLPSGELAIADVEIHQGTIARVGAGLAIDNLDEYQVIDGSGLILLPGVIDPQVHFREPGLEHKEDLFTSSCACVRGGVTSFLEMPNTRPLTTTQAALDDKLARAASKSLVNFGFFIGATKENLPDLRTASPTCGIKVFMGSMHGPLLVDDAESLDRIFYRDVTDSTYENRLIAVHAENHARILARREEFSGETDVAIHSEIQDNQAALEATQLALRLSKLYQRRLHILHLSTGDEANLLRIEKPAWVTAEVTPQHLLLNTDAYQTIGTLAQMNPPLRSPRDQDVLWQALLDGVIDFIATDHAPHTLEEKAKGYPNTPSGMPGVQTSLPLMLTQAAQGRCTVAQVSRWMSTAVANAYGIAKKGAIAPGYDADLVLVDLATYQPFRREDVLSKCGWSPFEGWNLTGYPQVTIVGGQVAYDHGTIDPAVRGKALQFGH